MAIITGYTINTIIPGLTSGESSTFSREDSWKIFKLVIDGTSATAINAGVALSPDSNLFNIIISGITDKTVKLQVQFPGDATFYDTGDVIEEDGVSLIRDK